MIAGEYCFAVSGILKSRLDAATASRALLQGELLWWLWLCTLHWCSTDAQTRAIRDSEAGATISWRACALKCCSCCVREIKKLYNSSVCHHASSKLQRVWLWPLQTACTT